MRPRSVFHPIPRYEHLYHRLPIYASALPGVTGVIKAARAFTNAFMCSTASEHQWRDFAHMCRGQITNRRAIHLLRQLGITQHHWNDRVLSSPAQCTKMRCISGSDQIDNLVSKARISPLRD